jgi:hypothetical protein
VAARHECDPDGKRSTTGDNVTTRRRHRPGVTTLTRESTDGHRDWDVVVGRTSGRIHGSQGGWQDSCGPTPMRENAAGDR